MTFLIGAGPGGAQRHALRPGLSGDLPSMGILVESEAFVAAASAASGSIRGAVLGGFILGSVEVIGKVILPSTYSDLISYCRCCS